MVHVSRALGIGLGVWGFFDIAVPTLWGYVDGRVGNPRHSFVDLKQIDLEEILMFIWAIPGSAPGALTGGVLAMSNDRMQGMKFGAGFAGGWALTMPLIYGMYTVGYSIGRSEAYGYDVGHSFTQVYDLTQQALLSVVPQSLEYTVHVLRTISETFM